MKEITLFYLPGCPYCKQAFRALEELAAEDARYAAPSIRKIDEGEQSALAEQYDYYYVPAMYLDGRKLYEAVPKESYDECKARVRRALDAALA